MCVFLSNISKVLVPQNYIITSKMEDNTTKEPTPAGALGEVYKRLGTRNNAVQDTLNLLTHRGLKASRASVYETIHGRSHRREIVEAFLEVAEAEFARRQQVEERAAVLLATNQSAG